MTISLPERGPGVQTWAKARVYMLAQTLSALM